MRGIAAEIQAESQHGEAVVGRITAPALVGEIAALADRARTATVRADGPVRALRLGRDAFVTLCQRNPGTLLAIIARLSGQLHSVSQALGLYAGGFSALERGDPGAAIIADLSHPEPELRAFAEAFQRMAGQILLERRRRAEMASAAVIQQAMLPRAVVGLDPLGRCDIFGDMTSARDVGGDLFDVFMLGEHRLALIIGDVCGKGVPASLFMAVTLTVLRLATQAGGEVAEILKRANAMLYAQNPSALFATVFLGVLDLRTGRLDYGNCGHNAPYRVRVGERCAPLPGSGTPLGIFPVKIVRPQTAQLAPGETLFLYTDGVTECLDPAGAEFGDERLVEILSLSKRAPPAELCRAVTAEVARFAAGAEPFDDITCLAVRWSERS